MTVCVGYDFTKTFRKGNERSNAAEKGAGTEKRHSGETAAWEFSERTDDMEKTNSFVPMM